MGWQGEPVLPKVVTEGEAVVGRLQEVVEVDTAEEVAAGPTCRHQTRLQAAPEVPTLIRSTCSGHRSTVWRLEAAMGP